MYTCICTLAAVLGPDDLAFLQNELHDIRHKWRNFGVQIGLDDGTLQAIRSEYTNHGDALREVLINWLKGSPTFKKLNKALNSRTVSEPNIADQIKEKLSSSNEGQHCPEYTESKLRPSLT